MALNAYHLTELGHTAVMDRIRAGGPIQEGVENKQHNFRVTKGSGMVISLSGRNILNGTSGTAFVPSTTGGLYMVQETSSTVSITASGGHASLPRIDGLFLSVNETTGAASYAYVTGTATAGAQVSSPGSAGFEVGAPATPASSIRICNVLVPATASSIASCTLVDRRPRARGDQRWERLESTFFVVAFGTGTVFSIDVILSGKAPLLIHQSASVTAGANGITTISDTVGWSTSAFSPYSYRQIHPPDPAFSLCRDRMRIFTPSQAGHHRVTFNLSSATAGGTSMLPGATFLVRELLTRSVPNT